MAVLKDLGMTSGSIFHVGSGYYLSGTWGERIQIFFFCRISSDNVQTRFPRGVKRKWHKHRIGSATYTEAVTITSFLDNYLVIATVI